MHRIVIIALSVCCATGVANSAYAKSSLTVVNGWNQPVDVAVFDGKDSTCQRRDAAEKGTVAAGASKSFSCQGQSKNRCRVTIFVANDNARYCKSLYQNCKSKATNVRDGGTVTLSGSGDSPDCAKSG